MDCPKVNDESQAVVMSMQWARYDIFVLKFRHENQSSLNMSLHLVG